MLFGLTNQKSNHARFPAFGTGWMFARPWRWLHILASSLDWFNVLYACAVANGLSAVFGLFKIACLHLRKLHYIPIAKCCFR